MDAADYPRPDVGIAEDSVLRYLIALNLAAQEAEFRGIIDNVAEDTDHPQLRDLVIATVAVLMSLGSVAWPIIMTTITALKRRTDDQLRSDALAIINGSHLAVPAGSATKVIDLDTMRETDADIHAFVSTVYSVTAIWDRAAEVLGT